MLLHTLLAHLLHHHHSEELPVPRRDDGLDVSAKRTARGGWHMRRLA